MCQIETFSKISLRDLDITPKRRRTAQLDLLLDDPGLDVVIPIALDPHNIPFGRPPVQTFDERRYLGSGFEVEPFLQTRGLDGGERGGNRGSDQETEGRDGLGVVGEVLTSDDCEVQETMSARNDKGG